MGALAAFVALNAACAQDPDALMAGEAGWVSCGECNADCRCALDEGDCDVDADCLVGLTCVHQTGTAYCP